MKSNRPYLIALPALLVLGMLVLWVSASIDTRAANPVSFSSVEVEECFEEQLEEDAEEMLPAIAYVLNFHHACDLAEEAVTVQPASTLKTVLELMDRNSIREIAVVDEDRHLVGTLEAKHILSHYLHDKAEASL